MRCRLRARAVAVLFVALVAQLGILGTAQATDEFHCVGRTVDRDERPPAQVRRVVLDDCTLPSHITFTPVPGVAFSMTMQRTTSAGTVAVEGPSADRVPQNVTIAVADSTVFQLHINQLDLTGGGVSVSRLEAATVVVSHVDFGGASLSFVGGNITRQLRIASCYFAGASARVIIEDNAFGDTDDPLHGDQRFYIYLMSLANGTAMRVARNRVGSATDDKRAWPVDFGFLRLYDGSSCVVENNTMRTRVPGGRAPYSAGMSITRIAMTNGSSFTVVDNVVDCTTANGDPTTSYEIEFANPCNDSSFVFRPARDERGDVLVTMTAPSKPILMRRMVFGPIVRRTMARARFAFSSANIDVVGGLDVRLRECSVATVSLDLAAGVPVGVFELIDSEVTSEMDFSKGKCIGTLDIRNSLLHRLSLAQSTFDGAVVTIEDSAVVPARGVLANEAVDFTTVTVTGGTRITMRRCNVSQSYSAIHRPNSAQRGIYVTGTVDGGSTLEFHDIVLNSSAHDVGKFGLTFGVLVTAGLRVSEGSTLRVARVDCSRLDVAATCADFTPSVDDAILHVGLAPQPRGTINLEPVQALRDSAFREFRIDPIAGGAGSTFTVRVKPAVTVPLALAVDGGAYGRVRLECGNTASAGGALGNVSAVALRRLNTSSLLIQGIAYHSLSVTKSDIDDLALRSIAARGAAPTLVVAGNRIGTGSNTYRVRFYDVRHDNGRVVIGGNMMLAAYSTAPYQEQYTTVYLSQSEFSAAELCIVNNTFFAPVPLPIRHRIHGGVTLVSTVVLRNTSLVVSGNEFEGALHSSISIINAVVYNGSVAIFGPARDVPWAGTFQVSLGKGATLHSLVLGPIRRLHDGAYSVRVPTPTLASPSVIVSDSILSSFTIALSGAVDSFSLTNVTAGRFALDVSRVLRAYIVAACTSETRFDVGAFDLAQSTSVAAFHANLLNTTQYSVTLRIELVNGTRGSHVSIAGNVVHSGPSKNNYPLYSVDATADFGGGTICVRDNEAYSMRALDDSFGPSGSRAGARVRALALVNNTFTGSASTQQFAVGALALADNRFERIHLWPSQHVAITGNNFTTRFVSETIPHETSAPGTRYALCNTGFDGDRTLFERSMDDLGVPLEACDAAAEHFACRAQPTPTDSGCVENPCDRRIDAVELAAALPVPVLECDCFIPDDGAEPVPAPLHPATATHTVPVGQQATRTPSLPHEPPATAGASSTAAPGSTGAARTTAAPTTAAPLPSPTPAQRRRTASQSSSLASLGAARSISTSAPQHRWGSTVTVTAVAPPLAAAPQPADAATAVVVQNGAMAATVAAAAAPGPALDIQTLAILSALPCTSGPLQDAGKKGMAAVVPFRLGDGPSAGLIALAAAVVGFTVAHGVVVAGIAFATSQPWLGAAARVMFPSIPNSIFTVAHQGIALEAAGLLFSPAVSGGARMLGVVAIVVCGGLPAAGAWALRTGRLHVAAMPYAVALRWAPPFLVGSVLPAVRWVPADDQGKVLMGSLGSVFRVVRAPEAGHLLLLGPAKRLFTAIVVMLPVSAVACTTKLWALVVWNAAMLGITVATLPYRVGVNNIVSLLMSAASAGVALMAATGTNGAERVLAASVGVNLVGLVVLFGIRGMERCRWKALEEAHAHEAPKAAPGTEMLVVPAAAGDAAPSADDSLANPLLSATDRSP